MVSRTVHRGKVRHLILTDGDELHDSEQEVRRVVVLAAWRDLKGSSQECAFTVFISYM